MRASQALQPGLNCGAPPGAVSENLSQIPQLVTIGENFLDVFLGS